MGKGGKKKAYDPLRDVRDAINRAMHRQHTPHMFISKQDLDQVWADHSLKDCFPKFKPEERRLVKTDYLRVLSILIHAEWIDLRLLFRPLFLRVPEHNDKNLPFEDLSFLGKFGSTEFSSRQHAFKPIIIQEHNKNYIQGVSPECRLPFIEEPEHMGRGGYGSVTKRVIAPRCLLNKQDNKDNPEVCGHPL